MSRSRLRLPLAGAVFTGRCSLGSGAVLGRNGAAPPFSFAFSSRGQLALGSIESVGVGLVGLVVEITVDHRLEVADLGLSRPRQDGRLELGLLVCRVVLQLREPPRELIARGQKRELLDRRLERLPILAVETRFHTRLQPSADRYQVHDLVTQRVNLGLKRNGLGLGIERNCALVTAFARHHRQLDHGLDAAGQ